MKTKLVMHFDSERRCTNNQNTIDVGLACALKCY